MTMILRIGLAAALLCAALGCNDRLDAPRLTRVDPSTGSNQQSTPVTIIGESFLAIPHSNFDDPGKAHANTEFAAWLEGNPLVAVTYVSSTWLRAIVPAGLAPGVYDLDLQDPDGRRAKLVDAFTVTGPLGPDLGAADATVDAAPPDGPSVDVPLLPDLFKPDLPQPDLLKPLGSPCFSDNECISGFCIEWADHHPNKVCCYKYCSSKKSDEGCSGSGTQCISD